MQGFWKRSDRLARELRGARPEAPADLIDRFEGRLRTEQPQAKRSYRGALPAAFTAVVLGGLAAVGGVSYAASSVSSAVQAVTHVFVPASTKRVVVLSGLSSGGDQYKPGYGYGDPNHNHSGPPGLKAGGDTANGSSSNAAFAPPLQPAIVGPTAIISTSLKIDEQAHLFISVLDKTTGKELLITQTKSTVGEKLSGVQAKTVNYLVLVPRTIPFKLAIPANYLQPSDKYAIRVIARDPQHNKTTLEIPFTS